MALGRKTVVAAAQAAVDSAEASSARTEEALLRARAGSMNRQRASTSSATRSAPASTYPAASATSAQQGVLSFVTVACATLVVRLGLIPRPPSTEVPVTGRNRSPGHQAFLQGSVA